MREPSGNEDFSDSFGSPPAAPCETPCLGKAADADGKTLDRAILLQSELAEQRASYEELLKENEQLNEKLKKVEAELDQRRARELKVKNMHEEEMKFKDEINGFEQQLF